MNTKTFTLDGTVYELDSVLGDARQILNNIFQVKEKARIEEMVNHSALSVLTNELNGYKEEFKVAPTEVTVEK